MKKERWVIIFSGPGMDRHGEPRVNMMTDGDGDSDVAAVFDSSEKARQALVGHVMKDHVAWLLNLNDGETEESLL